MNTSTETDGPIDGLGNIIHIGDTIMSTNIRAALKLGVTARVTAIISDEGHAGALVWSIGVQPDNGGAGFQTCTPEIYAVMR